MWITHEDIDGYNAFKRQVKSFTIIPFKIIGFSLLVPSDGRPPWGKENIVLNTSDSCSNACRGTLNKVFSTYICMYYCVIKVQRRYCV